MSEVVSVREFLIEILHPTVMIRSYKNEKRHVIPPPMVRLSGDGWRSMPQPMACLEISASAIQMVGLAKKNNGYEGVVRSLFVRENGRRRSHDLKMHLVCNPSLDSAEAPTRSSYRCPERILALAKPSVGNQWLKDKEGRKTVIESGSMVSIFNRRSTTNKNSTGFLYVTGNQFYASPQHWSAFEIHRLSDNEEDSDGDSFQSTEGIIRYGDVLKLVDRESGFSLPKMRICRITGPYAEVVCTEDGDLFRDPVGQLQKLALLLIDDGPRQFLCANGNRIVTDNALAVDHRRYHIPDSAIWTMVSVAAARFQFFDRRPPGATVDPIPMISGVDVYGEGQGARVELNGSDLRPDLTICFGATTVQTIYRNAQTILCIAPPLSQIANWTSYQAVNGLFRVPISLLRKEDGIVYGSQLAFQYRVQCPPVPH